MQITVNGQPITLTAPCSVQDLLSRQGLDDQPCAVEINRNVVRKADHPDHQIADGDTIEIVTLVGGG